MAVCWQACGGMGKEFGTELADTVTVRVHDSNADMRYLVLPMRPPGTEGWSEDALAHLVTRDLRRRRRGERGGR
jgi:hypothetical protein